MTATDRWVTAKDILGRKRNAWVRDRHAETADAKDLVTTGNRESPRTENAIRELLRKPSGRELPPRSDLTTVSAFTLVQSQQKVASASSTVTTVEWPLKPAASTTSTEITELQSSPMHKGPSLLGETRTTEITAQVDRKFSTATTVPKPEDKALKLDSPELRKVLASSDVLDEPKRSPNTEQAQPTNVPISAFRWYTKPDGAVDQSNPPGQHQDRLDRNPRRFDPEVSSTLYGDFSKSIAQGKRDLAEFLRSTIASFAQVQVTLRDTPQDANSATLLQIAPDGVSTAIRPVPFSITISAPASSTPQSRFDPTPSDIALLQAMRFSLINLCSQQAQGTPLTQTITQTVLPSHLSQDTVPRALETQGELISPQLSHLMALPSRASQNNDLNLLGVTETMGTQASQIATSQTHLLSASNVAIPQIKGLNLLSSPTDLHLKQRQTTF
ncbi:hypothetical protein L596_005944 [Steinernema carpocapsae]|uniref:Uncharacterized protein n=1 Tax=Steinernema carpocapsae TaxID=34508 RepID=A0A4U8V265_STECR|nr:hypothetical protein L596_005944 [Steinernema carpocapsae]